MSNEELRTSAKAAAAQVAGWSGRFALLFAELDRRRAWREDGAASAEAWIVSETGASIPSARAQAHVAERVAHLPHLAKGFCSGQVSFDQVRAVADVATPRSDDRLAHAAADGASVLELMEMARASAPPPRTSGGVERATVRCNPTTHTITAQLPKVEYASVVAFLEARAKRIPSDGSVPWDERMGGAFIDALTEQAAGGRPLGGSFGRPLVVAHVPLEALIDEEGATTSLFGELQRGGLISAQVIARLACEGAVVVAVDDAEGHTMYEGRMSRDATDAQRREILRRDRHCRFPGCDHVVFSQPHHMAEWEADLGPTDLDNLLALCTSHHGLLHSKGWSVSGDANVEVTFRGPNGRVRTSRPSPLWTRVSSQDGRRLVAKEARAGPSG